MHLLAKRKEGAMSQGCHLTFFEIACQELNGLAISPFLASLNVE
jgi:hypothetical protein